MKTNQNLIKFEGGLDLESGARLDSFELMVETYGELNKNRSNGILVCHAFSGNHQAAGIINDKKKLGGGTILLVQAKLSIQINIS